MAGDRDPLNELMPLAARLRALKTWSVIVTVLGDLSQQGESGVANREISGPDLSAILERFGLQAQAMRVALHRLKQDGWIASRRDGRVSHYRLTEPALAESTAVSGLIYGKTGSCGDPLWLVVRSDADGSAAPADALALGRRSHVVSSSASRWPEDWLVVPFAPDDLPGWATSLAAEAAQHAAFDALGEAIGQWQEDDLPGAVADRMALRVLVLHVWRVIVLRANAAALQLSHQGPPQTCRNQVLPLLQKLWPLDRMLASIEPGSP